MFGSLIPRRNRLPMLGEFERDFPSLWERFLDTDDWMGFVNSFTPKTNVAETVDTMEVTIELPGMKAEEVKVEVHADQLWVMGEKKEEKEEKDKTFHRVERRFGEFKRVIQLPGRVDAAKVNAEFKDGILRVAIPKSA